MEKSSGNKLRALNLIEYNEAAKGTPGRHSKRMSDAGKLLFNFLYFISMSWQGRERRCPCLHNAFGKYKVGSNNSTRKNP
jgi:hypothetical protein